MIDDAGSIVYVRCTEKNIENIKRIYKILINEVKVNLGKRVLTRSYREKFLIWFTI